MKKPPSRRFFHFPILKKVGCDSHHSNKQHGGDCSVFKNADMDIHNLNKRLGVVL
jgi:hypothetical protein